MKPKIFITRKLPAPGIKLLEPICDVDVNPSMTPPTKDILIERARDSDGILCMLTDQIDANVINSSTKLKVISSMSVGYDHIDVDLATKRGIYVVFTPGVLTNATAEFTWALLLAVSRRIVEADNHIRAGKWRIHWSPTEFLGAELAGKTLGIVGLGRIGKEVAIRARGFKMKVIYHNRRRVQESEEELGVEWSHSLNELLRDSDFVTVHVCLTDDTKHLIGEEQLKQMRRTAYLINTSRGQVIDQLALRKALSENWIAGAALDVFEKEPINVDDSLLKFENVIMTPHIGSATKQARSKMSELAAKNIISILRGEEPEFLVNKGVQEVKPLSQIRML